MSNTANRIIKNTGWLYAKMGITMFISLYTTRLIFNSLGEIDFGIFNIVGGAIAMLGFMNAALATATQRFMSYAEGEGNTEKKIGIFNVSIVLHFCIACFVGLVLVLCGYFFFFNGGLNIPDERFFAAKVVYGSLIISTMFTVMTVPYDAVMNSRENMRYYAYIGIFESLLKLLVAYICVKTSFDKLIVYGILMAVIPLITLSIMRIYCHMNYAECRIGLRRYFSTFLAKEMVCFAGWTFITTVTSMVTQYGMGLILNHFFGVVVNAAHGLATQLSGMLMTFSLNAQKALNPVLIKSEGGQDRNRMIYISLLGCRISFFIFGFFSLPVILLMPLLLNLWLKDVPEWAVIFSQLQLVRILLEQLVVSLISAINAEGHIAGYSKMRSITYILPMVLAPFSFYYGFPPYWMLLITIVCWCILGGIGTLYYACKGVGLDLRMYLFQVLLPSIIVVLFSLMPYSAVCLFVDGIEVRIGMAILEVLLFGCLGFFFLLNRQEQALIKQRIYNFKFFTLLERFSQEKSS